MKSQKIGYYVADVNLKQTSSIGIYRFTINLLEQLIKRRIEITLFCNEQNHHLFKRYSKKIKKIIKLKRVCNNHIVNRFFLDQIMINKYIKKERLTKIVFPRGFMPLYKIKGIQYYIVIHDLIPRYYLFNKKLSWKMRLKFLPATIMLMLAIKKADKIFTVSDFSQEEINNHTSKKKVKVIVEGCNLNSLLNKLTKKLECIKGKPYFYIIGNQNPHKNLERSIELFLDYNKIHKNKFNAIVTVPKIKKFEKEGAIKFLGHVKDKELATIYKRASISLFLSDIEGFGLPLIESYSLETPVVFNNKTSLAEIGRNLKGSCNIKDQKSVFKAINESLGMNKKEILKNKKKLVNKYNWEECGNKFIKEL